MLRALREVRVAAPSPLGPSCTRERDRDAEPKCVDCVRIVHTTANVLDFGQFGADRLILTASSPDGIVYADGKQLAAAFDRNADGMLDARDTPLGSGASVDEAANTITLNVAGDRLTLHGLTALPTDWIS